MSGTPRMPNELADFDTNGAALCNLKGYVYRVMDGYGFITIAYPVKASVFAHRSSIVNPRPYDANRFGLRVGDRVIMDIKKSLPIFTKSQFQAVRVELIESEANLEQQWEISNQEGTVFLVNEYGGTLKFGRGNEEYATFDRRCIPETLIRPWESVSDIFLPGSKVDFNARLVTNPSTGITQWQATLVTTTLHESISQVFDYDVAPTRRERYGTKNRFGNKLIFLPFSSYCRGLLQSCEWNPWYWASAANSHWLSYELCTFFSASFLPSFPTYRSNSSLMFTANAAPVTSTPVRMQRGIAATRRHDEKDKLGFVPVHCDPQRTVDDGHCSTEQDIATSVDGHPVPADDDKLPKAKSPEGTSSSGIPVATGSCPIDTTSAAEKQSVPCSRANRPRAAVHRRLPTTAGSFKRGVDYQHNAVAQKQPDVDSSRVNDNSSDASEPPSEKPAECVSPDVLMCVHNDVKATVEQVRERSALVSFQHGRLAACTDVRAFCIYKDGIPIMGDLRHVLHVGDELMMDCILGSAGDSLLAHCNAMWQGRKPQGAPSYISLEAFQSVLEQLKAASEGPVLIADSQSPDDNVAFVGNSRASAKPQHLPFEAAETCDINAGATEDEKRLVEATVELVVTCLKKVFHEEFQALRLKVLDHMGITAEAVNIMSSSDLFGLSLERSGTMLHPLRPHTEACESRDTAAGADKQELLDLHEDDLQIISVFINEGTQAIIEELKALRPYLLRCLCIIKEDVDIGCV